MPTDKPDLSRAIAELWRDLCEKDDRTSPEEYPDMALINEGEFAVCLQAYADISYDNLRATAAAYDRLTAVNAALVAALDRIKKITFYHMTRHADERGDRKVLGEVKEIAIAALKLAEETGNG